MIFLSACASSSCDDPLPNPWVSTFSSSFCCSFIWIFCRSFCFVRADAVETWAGADAMATGLSGLMRLAGGATGMVVVATLDTRGSGSTTVWATTSVTFGGFSPAEITSMNIQALNNISHYSSTSVASCIEVRVAQVCSVHEILILSYKLWSICLTCIRGSWLAGCERLLCRWPGGRGIFEVLLKRVGFL